jgi:hypothetical protein
MIRFDRIPDPDGFDVEVRQRGKAWLNEHPPHVRPRPFWTTYVPHLAQGFQSMCAYTAMHIEEGTADHYLCCAKHRHLAYEWTNYRYTSPRMNSIKGTADDRVLDPFEVGDNWFEVLLPSLELIPTEHVPASIRERVAFTLRRLGLRDGEAVIRRRRSWYQQFFEGGLSLAGLRRYAILIGRAVDRRLERIEPTRFGEAEPHYRLFLDSTLTLAGLRRTAPDVGRAVDAELRRHT